MNLKRWVIYTLFPLHALALPLDRYPEAHRLIDQLAAEGFDRREIEAALKRAEIQDSILKAMQRPAEKMSWARYRKIFLTKERIDKGVSFWKRHRTLVQKISEHYGVPPEILVAILGVETFYGQWTGKHRVLDALATLAFAYPKRSKFFMGELRHFFLLSREERLDLFQPKGSYAGAMGWPQFIPSSYRKFAVDFDGDGRRNLWQPEDALASVAHYFKRHGWHAGEPVTIPIPPVAKRLITTELKPPKWTVGELRRMGVKIPKRFADHLKAMVIQLDGEYGPEYWLVFHNFYVITRYNHSPLYAMAVYQLARELRIHQASLRDRAEQKNPSRMSDLRQQNPSEKSDLKIRQGGQISEAEPKRNRMAL